MFLNSIKLRAFADQMNKLAQSIDMPTLMALLGGGGGAYAAYKGTHDPRAKMRNALLASLPAAGLGYFAGKKLFPNPPSIGQDIAAIKGGLGGLSEKERAYSEALKTIGEFRGSLTPPSG